MSLTMMQNMQILDEDTEYRHCTNQDSQESEEEKKDDNISSVCETTVRYISDKSSESILFRLNEVEEVCRICLSSGSIPIFGSVDISDDLERFASIEVRADDCLPQQICTKCQELLDSAIILRKIAQNTDRVLRRKAEEVDNESHDSQSNSVGKMCTEEMLIGPATVETSDGENSEHGVYLEYAESENDNESESEYSIEEINVSLVETASIVESIEPYSEDLQTLVDSLNKNAKWIQCEICNLIFRTSEQLNEHTSTHDSEEIVICEVCKNIIHKDLYTIHLKLHKESFRQRTKNQTIECTVCGKSYKKSIMKKHMNIHEKGEDRLKTCTVCFKTVTVNYLSTHMKRLHSQKDISVKSHYKEKKHACPVCSRMFRESVYKDHVASHAASRKKYVCEECGLEMFAYSSFKTHILTHKDVYNFKCQFCPYRGKHLGLLKIHVRTHTKDYAYQCSVCNARFITKSNLTAHLKTHFSGAQIVCSECGLCFPSERSLRYHRSLKHKAKPVFCDICGKKYAFNNVLYHHKRRVHHVPPKPVGRTPSYLLAAQQDKGEEISQLDCYDNKKYFHIKSNT